MNHIPCPTCNGFGRFDDYPCPACNGSGEALSKPSGWIANIFLDPNCDNEYDAPVAVRRGETLEAESNVEAIQQIS